MKYRCTASGRTARTSREPFGSTSLPRLGALVAIQSFKPSQPPSNLVFQFTSAFKLGEELLREALDLLVDRFVVGFGFGGADVAAWGEHVVMLHDLFQRGRFREAGDVLV